MPPKPKTTMVNHGAMYHNRSASAAGRALSERGLARLHFAIKFDLEDCEAGNPAKGRYTRIRNAIMERFNCCDSEATRTIKRMRIYLAEQFLEELPVKRAEVCKQLQRIADQSEVSEPIAAVAALREQARIIGLHAPLQLEVAQSTQAPELDLRQVMDCLDERGRAALDVVLEQVEAARAAGRLPALAAGAEDGDEPGVIDVEPGPEGSAPPAAPAN